MHGRLRSLWDMRIWLAMLLMLLGLQARSICVLVACTSESLMPLLVVHMVLHVLCWLLRRVLDHLLLLLLLMLPMKLLQLRALQVLMLLPMLLLMHLRVRYIVRRTLLWTMGCGGTAMHGQRPLAGHQARVSLLSECICGPRGCCHAGRLPDGCAMLM